LLLRLEEDDEQHDDQDERYQTATDVHMDLPYDRPGKLRTSGVTQALLAPACVHEAHSGGHGSFAPRLRVKARGAERSSVGEHVNSTPRERADVVELRGWAAAKGAALIGDFSLMKHRPSASAALRTCVGVGRTAPSADE